MGSGWDPDWVIAPGATLEEWMVQEELSIPEAAELVEMELDELVNFLAGRVGITEELAQQLYLGTGISKGLWLALEAGYRQGLAAGKVDATRT